MVPAIVFVAIGAIVLFLLVLIYLLYVVGCFTCCNSWDYEREKQRLIEDQQKITRVTGNERIDLLIHKMSDFNVPYDELEFGDLLGKGSQGEVYLAQWRGTTIAVKKVDTTNIEPTTVEEFCQEASMMRHMHHYSLTQFLGISFQSHALCILTEYVERGSLFDIIQDTKSTYTWQRGIDVMTDVARGMHYLHSHKPPILHRDLKSLNILVTRDWRGKIADFGMTRFQDPDAAIVMTQCGSPYWMAPEMIQNLTYDEKSDVYSFGVCLWEIYTRQIPYRDTGLNAGNVVVRVVRDSLRPTVPSSMPKPYYRLMERCWHADPNKRPSFKQIVRVLESFQDDPVISSHVPFDPRASQAAIEARERAKQRFLEESADVRNIFKDGWLLENPTRDITLDNVTANERHDFLVELYRQSGARRFNEAAMDPYPHLNQALIVPTSNVVVDIPSLTADPSEPPSDPSKPLRPYVLTRHVGTVLPEQQTQLMLYAIFPPDMHYAKIRATYTCVRVLHLTALAKDPERTKGDPIPSYALDRYGTGAKFLKSLKLTTDPAINERVKHYLQALSNIRHPNIVLYMGGYVMPDYVGVATEQMHQGILTPLLDLRHIIFEWNFCLSILSDIAKGLQYLFTLQTPIIPNNFGPDMVLVDRNWRCKLSAVDIFPSLDEYIYGSSPAMPHPPTAYTAPELVENFMQKPKHTMAAAIYAMGILINQLFAREKPYNGIVDAKTLRRIVKKNMRPKIPSLMPPELAHLVKRCLSGNPEERPSIETIVECLEHQKEIGPPRTELREGVDGVRRYHKQATVVAFFSSDPVTVYKDWGKNEVGVNNFVIRSIDGDVYAVEGDIFRRSYVPVEGGEDEYRKLGTVLAKQMMDPFVVGMKRGSVAHGQAGDFLVQDPYGEQWVIDGNLFVRMYSEDYSQEDLDADARARQAALAETDGLIAHPPSASATSVQEEKTPEETPHESFATPPMVTIDVLEEKEDKEKKVKKKKKKSQSLSPDTNPPYELNTRRRTRQDVLVQKMEPEQEREPPAASPIPVMMDPVLRNMVSPIPHYTGTGEDLVAYSERDEETDRFDDNMTDRGTGYTPVAGRRPASDASHRQLKGYSSAPSAAREPRYNGAQDPQRKSFSKQNHSYIEPVRPSSTASSAQSAPPPGISPVSAASKPSQSSSQSLYIAQLQIPTSTANSSGHTPREQHRRGSAVSPVYEGVGIPVAATTGLKSPTPQPPSTSPTPYRTAAPADALGVAPGSMASLMSLKRRASAVETPTAGAKPAQGAQYGLYNAQMNNVNKT